MKQATCTLLTTRDVFNDIASHVEQTCVGLETGVSIFGTAVGASYVVLAVAGPGRNASHAPGQYSGDSSHSSDIFNALRTALPGIRWLGELHVHPDGMTWLSGRDLRTVKEILTGTDETLHPDEFIAGVMQRKHDALRIYPFHFTREWLKGRPMEFRIVDANSSVVKQARLKGLTHIDPMFARNAKEALQLSRKHVAVVGCGSVGSAFVDMAVRSGIGRFTLIDPDVLAPENLGRHTLSRSDLGTFKAESLKHAILKLNPAAEVRAVCSKFADLEEKPDLLVAVTDSFACQSKVNDCALRYGVPAIFAGCWGEASVGEVLFMIPGKTPCYQCYADFRKDTVEIPDDPRRYTEPDLDPTKLPGQAGLWANILTLTGFLFQVALGMLHPDNERSQLIDYEHTLLLINVSKYDSNLQPLAVTFGKVNKGCAICDESKLAGLGDDLAPGQCVADVQTKPCSPEIMERFNEELKGHGVSVLPGSSTEP